MPRHEDAAERWNAVNIGRMASVDVRVNWEVVVENWRL